MGRERKERKEGRKERKEGRKERKEKREKRQINTMGVPKDKEKKRKYI